MDDKIKYVSRQLKRTLFNSNKEEVIVPILVKAISLLNHKSNSIEQNQFKKWNTESDINLARHLIFMYEKSKGENLQKIGTNEFIQIWDTYVYSEEYYQQILSYIVNAEDYKMGDRFAPNFDGITMRDSKYIINTMKLWNDFSEDSLMKRQYYSRVFIIAKQLFDVINT